MPHSYYKFCITVIAALALSTLAGCQSFAPKEQATPYSALEQRHRLPKLKHWQAEGKISFSRGPERHNANFNWQQFNQNYSIHIFGPFGLGATWLKRSSRTVTLENAKLGTHQASTVEELMESLVGWQAPISNMQYWIKGIAAPSSRSELDKHGSPVTTKNDKGLLQTLQQQGWQVNITQYQAQGRWQLPRKIIAIRDQMRLVVIIKRWQPRTSSFWY